MFVMEETSVPGKLTVMLGGFDDGDLAARQRRIHIWHRGSLLSAVVNFSACIADGTFKFGFFAMSLRVTVTRGSTKAALHDMLKMIN